MYALEKSPFYQELIQRWFVLGQQEGLHRGREEGREEGHTEAVAKAICRTLLRRFGAVPTELERKLSALPVERLDKLFDVALDSADLDQFLRSFTQLTE